VQESPKLELATAGPLHRNWATTAAHGGGRPVLRRGKMDAQQPPQAHHGVG
jgi:hypothetical protein